MEQRQKEGQRRQGESLEKKVEDVLKSSAWKLENCFTEQEKYKESMDLIQATSSHAVKAKEILQMAITGNMKGVNDGKIVRYCSGY